MSGVLVIGGTGLFGSFIVRELSERGHEVAVTTRSQDAERDGVRRISTDLRSPEMISAAVAGMDAVVVCMPLSDGPRQGFVPERDGVRNLLRALQDRRDVCLLKLSEIGAGTDPDFFDLQMKAEADDAIRASGHPHVVLRPTWIMEAWPKQLSAPGGLVLAPTNRNGVHWVSVRDVAYWFVEALDRWETVQGKALVAQGPARLSFAEAAERFARKTGRRVIPAPRQLFALGAPFSSRMRTLHELFRYYDRAPERLQAQETWDLLGRPQVQFDDFLAGLDSWFDASLAS